MAALLLGGAATVALLYPLCCDRRRLALKRRWAGALLDSLGVTVEADLDAAVPGSLLVANHISWLDILVVNAVLPAAFVAKAEVRNWPVLGWLAAKNDTVFLQRGSRGHAQLINRQIADLLATGKHVAVFPEGTTTDGTHLLHFHAALLQPALAAGRPVVPVALSYWEVDGSRSLAPRYDGEISLGESFDALLARRKVVARLVTTPALGLNGEDRRAVAAAAREAISSAAGIPQPSNPPEKPGDPPGARPSNGPPTGSPNRAPADSATA